MQANMIKIRSFSPHCHQTSSAGSQLLIDCRGLFHTMCYLGLRSVDRYIFPDAEMVSLDI